MAVSYSTGFVTGLQGSTGLKASGMFNAFFLDIYSGAQPINADQAPSGTLLATISVGGTGTACTFGTPAAGIVLKNSAETWKGPGLANGTPGWLRVRRAGDLGTTNTTDIRVDMNIASIGGDIRLGNPTVVTGQDVDINTFGFNWTASG